MPFFALASACLIAQHRIIAQHPEDDSAFRKRFDLGRGMGLLGASVVNDWWTSPLPFKPRPYATAQANHRD